MVITFIPVPDLGLQDFTISVGYTFDETYNSLAFFNVCTTYTGHPLPGIPHRFDCENIYKGRYVAIWMTGAKQMEICDIDVHVLSSKLPLKYVTTIKSEICGSL